MRSLAEVLISWTTENREVSSANSLHSLLRPSDKSLTYIKNNKGPRMDSWRRPVLVSAQYEHWIFKTTLCFLLRRKSRKMLMISLLIPFWGSLGGGFLAPILTFVLEKQRCSDLLGSFTIRNRVHRIIIRNSDSTQVSWFMTS